MRKNKTEAATGGT